jgi:hypothetical protein
MKKKILSVIFLLFVLQSWGQIKTKVFTLNLGEPTTNSLKDSVDESTNLVVKSKELLAFKLVNGNPYKYKYVINHKFVNLFEGQEYNPLDSIGKIIGQQKKTETNPHEIIDLKAKIETELKEKQEELKKIKIKLFASNFKSANKNLLMSKQLQLKTQINSLENQLKNLSSQSNSQYISKSTYSSSFINNTKFNNLLNILKSRNAKNEEDDKINIKNASIVLKQSFDDLKIDIDKYEAEISAEDFLNKSEFITKREDFNKRFLKLIIDLQGINDEVIDFPDLTDDFNKKVVEISKISEKIKASISKMYKVKLHNYLLPVDINGKNIDVVEITVERYDKTATNPTPDKCSYNIWVKDGLKIDISGGLFITSLLDKEFETKDDTNGNKFIYEKNNGDYEFGFGSTLNISLRGGSWVRPGLSIGALFTTNQKFQLLTGLGIILGKEERVVLHAGLSMGRITKISGDYKTDGSTSYNLGTVGTVPTTDKFSFGHFFGITYNLGKVKKQDDKQK